MASQYGLAEYYTMAEDAKVQAQTQAAVDLRLGEVAVEDASVLRTAGQRKINLIWEVTQAIVAIAVTVTTLGTCAWMVLKSGSADSGAFLLLSNVFFLVVGTYFQRTNHSNVGGVKSRDMGR